MIVINSNKIIGFEWFIKIIVMIEEIIILIKNVSLFIVGVFVFFIWFWGFFLWIFCLNFICFNVGISIGIKINVISNVMIVYIKII